MASDFEKISYFFLRAVFLKIFGFTQRINKSTVLGIIQCIHKRMVRFQKLTRNLLLNLHRHNVHRQQRQLSKFLMRYQQFASRAYCGTAGPVSKMASQQENAFYVHRFEVSRSVITVRGHLGNWPRNRHEKRTAGSA